MSVISQLVNYSAKEQPLKWRPEFAKLSCNLIRTLVLSPRMKLSKYLAAHFGGGFLLPLDRFTPLERRVCKRLQHTLKTRGICEIYNGNKEVILSISSFV